jgi:GTP-binding protein
MTRDRHPAPVSGTSNAGSTRLLPVVAIVGRPNVGKSTLFNRLTRSREALVADVPGLTRDRRYGTVRDAPRPFVVIDTGGLAAEADAIGRMVEAQVELALDESDLVLLLLDARDGLTAEDERIAGRVRGRGAGIVAVLNKIDGLDPDLAAAEFHRLGLGPVHPIAAVHGHGVGALVEALAAALPATPEGESEEALEAGPPAIRVAVVGRPNVGKSTLVNALVGAPRVLAHDEPGTTRDSVLVPFERGGRRFVLIDTAGVRRRSRVAVVVEKFSVVKTLQAIDHAHVVLLMADAAAGLVEQDLRLLGHVLDAGRGLVVALNKWDAADEEQRRAIRSECDRRLGFAGHPRLHPLSARRGTGLGALTRSVERTHVAARADLATPDLTRVLARAVAENPPPVVGGRRAKLRYAHQGGTNPPRIVIHGNRTETLPDAYRRYLMRKFREAFDLEGTPVRLELRSAENPFRDRSNPLTARQREKRRRLMRHVKRKR